ncbi:hypothetical protein Tco_0633883, partial [Tanacetum coccineum]
MLFQPSTSQPQRNKTVGSPKRKDTQIPSPTGPFEQGRIDAIDADDDITLVSVHDVNVSVGKEEVVEVINTAKLIIDAAQVSAAGDKVSIADAATTVSVATTTTATTVEEITLAQALADLKSTKPKAKGIAFREPGESTTTTTPIPSKIQDKGKAKMIEPEPVKKLSKKDQLKLDEEIALKLQAEIDEEERIARAEEEKIDEANIAWDDIQAKVDADYQLAERLQAEEQEQFTIEQKATLFKELLEQRRKHFAAKRAEEKRNKPPTKTQQKKTMITYLKNMEGWKHKDLKSKDFDSIKELFDKALKRVNMFVDFRTELVEGSSKRAGTELEQEVTKKQKVDDVQETAKVDNDQEAAKIKELIEIVPNEEEVAIDAIPLAVKPPTIVDWKIHKEGKNNYYQIIRADGSSKMYKNDLKTMFEPHIEDEIWKLQQRYKVLSWKLFDSCRVHCLSLQSGMIYMLIEKRYPFTPPIITEMLNKKLQIDYEMCKTAGEVTTVVYDTYGGCKGDYLAEWTQMESGAELRLVAVVAIGVFTHEILGPRFANQFSPYASFSRLLLLECEGLSHHWGVKDIQCAGSDTRPPMLDKADFVSWQQRIRLYCRGKDNGINILKSIDEGPFQMGTTRGIIDEGTEGPINLGPERPRVYSELSQEEKDRYNADIRATNIILQGLPKDIYSLINHYIDAKDIWDNVKMLLEGSELTKEDRESQLYDDFEHFRQNKGETIHSYYVRFAKLINDMRNIKMTMSKIQLNSKFVNNMLPEWGRFVTAVKL